MFEKEIQFITDFNLNKIKTLGKSFNMDELFNTELHPALIKYISGRLDLMIYEERKILLENSRFDYSGGKIAEYFNHIADEIKKTRKLSFAETEDFIKRGMLFNANFCVQPKSTLINLIYKDADTSKSTSEIKVYLNYLYYYDYYHKIINSYISRRKIVNLSKDEFRALLDKIDRELLSSKREDIISDALNSISDFYNDGGISKSSLQPALVEAYLKEKNLDEMIEILHYEIRDNKNKIDIRELKKILFSKPTQRREELQVTGTKPEKGEVSIEAETETEEVSPGIELKVEKNDEEISKSMEIKDEEKIIGKLKVEEGAKGKIDEAEKIRIEEKENIYKKQIDTQHLPERQETKDKMNFSEQDIKQPVNEKETDKDDIIFDEEILENHNQKDEIDMEELIEDDVPVKKERKREKDIFSFIGQKEIEKIVSAIFNDDEDDFANTLEKISESGNYDRAAEILQSVFYTYRVNPYKREAVILTNAVSNYFDQG
ncbi:MAG TPA: hypothetical protein VGA29_07520 [Ignavibacteriaceae bacterium]|jgi:hypothetical protein